MRKELPTVRSWGLVAAPVRSITGGLAIYSGAEQTAETGNPFWVAAGTTAGVTEATGGIMYGAGAFGGSSVAMGIGARVAALGGHIGLGLSLLYLMVTAEPGEPGGVCYLGMPPVIVYLPGGNKSESVSRHVQLVTYGPCIGQDCATSHIFIVCHRA